MPPLCANARLADVGLTAGDWQVGEFRDEAGGGGELLELVGTDGLVTELQFEIRDDAGQIGVAAAFAVPVHAALDVSGARP